MAAGSHQEALRQLEAIPEGVPDRAAPARGGRRRVAAADELCRRSRVPGTADRERGRLLTEALRECADHAEARSELARIPPGPRPGGLAAEVDVAVPSVTLSWTPSGEREVRYVVMRATSGRTPTSVEGGRHQQRMGIVNGARWEDRNPVLGIPLRYAVFTERAGTASATPAVTPEAVFVMGEPEVRAAPRDGGADLEWTLPAAAEDVEIRRERIDGAEPGRSPASNGGRRLADRDLRNGVRYRYTLRARYADRTAPGGVRRSAGRSVEVTPHRVPEPPRAGGGNRGGPAGEHDVLPAPGHAALAAAPDGTMHVVRVDGPVGLQPGDQVPEVDLQPVRARLHSALRPCTTPGSGRAGAAGTCPRWSSRGSPTSGMPGRTPRSPRWAICASSTLGRRCSCAGPGLRMRTAWSWRGGAAATRRGC